VTETRLDDDLVVFCFLYLVVTETRFIKNKKQQGRHPILFKSLLDIQNNKVVIQSCFSHY
jgi:hypothetical protein